MTRLWSPYGTAPLIRRDLEHLHALLWNLLLRRVGYCDTHHRFRDWECAG